MNILVISFSVNGVMGDNFKQVIAMLRDQGISLSILTNENICFENIDVCNVRFNRKKITDFINPVSYYKIWKYIRNANYDKVLVLSPHPANIIIHKWIDPQKLYYYLHDNEPHSGFPKKDLFFYKIQLNLIYNSACGIIVSSNAIKNDIIEKKPTVDKNRIFVIYLSVLQNLQFDFDSDLDVSEPIDVLFFGRLEYYKGIDVLIEANAYTKTKYNYLLISKGDLKAVFNISDLPNNFKHINEYVSDYNLAKYIHSSKLVVMPYRDATGTQVIQTVFFYNKPIVATNVGCFPEYITDGVDGIIVPKENAQQLAQAMDELLSDKVLREKMGVNGKLKLNLLFSNQILAKRYVELFYQSQL